MLKETVGYALSLQQRRVWQQIARGDRLRAQVAVEITGCWNADKIRAALTSVAQKHEALRTGFECPSGARLPLQVITEEALVQWNQQVGIDPSENGIDSLLNQIFASEADAVLNGTENPLRAFFLASSSRAILIITVSPLCADFNSLLRIVEDLIAVYGGSKDSEEATPVQYPQFSEWQNELLASEEAVKAMEVLGKTEDSSAVRLPFEQSGHEAGSQVILRVTLDQELVAAAERLAGRKTNGMPAIWLAGWQVLLQRHLQQAGVVVGKSFDCRDIEELRDGVGLYAKYLPLNAHLEKDSSFLDVFNGAVVQMQNASDWQQYAPVIQDGPEGDTASFAYLFDCFDLPSAREIAGAKFAVVAEKLFDEPCKLKLEVKHQGDRWYADFSFDDRHFTKDDLVCLSAQYVELLNGALAQPDTPVGKLNINPPLHKAMLQQWRQTEQLDLRGGTLHGLFEEQARLGPERIAVRDELASLTYGELDQRANQIAHILQGKGITTDSVVGICMERGVSLVAGALGILKAGGAYLPLDASYPQDRLDYMLNDSSVQVIITQAKFKTQFAAPDRELISIDELETIHGNGTKPVETPKNPNSLAYVIYTSGSTGRPKGVMVEHQGAVNYVKWAKEFYAAQAGTGAPVHSPLAFDLTVTSLWCVLAAGSCVEMISEKAGIEGLAQALSSGTNYSLVKLTPSHLESLRELMDSGSDCKAKCFVVGGEALKQQTADWWLEHVPGLRMVNEYGPTETVVGCSTYDVQAEDGSAEAPIGGEISNLRMYVLNEYLEEAGLWETGEIYIAGTGVARGYLGRPELTAERFLPEPSESFPGGRMYRSGDLGRRRSDGNLEYLGRCDEQVKIRGHRVELGEIEAVLAHELGIKQSAVVVQNQESGMTLVCYFVAESGTRPEPEKLREALRVKLPEYMVPGHYIALDSLPLTTNGKLDKRALPQPGKERSQSRPAFVAPVSPAEQALAKIWSEVLGLEQVGRNDNYFTLGGDSIRSVRVVALARKRGIKITLQSLFQHQILHELASHADVCKQELAHTPAATFSLVTESDRPKLPSGLEDAYPLSMLQAGMLYHLELETAAAMYHNISSFHIKAQFAAEPFQNAVAEVIERHPIFRTSFDLSSYSEALQLVHKSAESKVEVQDLRGLEFDQQQDVIQQYVEIQKGQPLDLAQAPLLRFCIHRRTNESFNFTVTICHAILDGWSVSSTIAELFERYFALLNQLPISVEPPLRSTFRDFVQLERQAIHSPEFQQFWMTKLENCAPVPLPRWERSQEEDEQKGGFIRLALSADLLSDLSELARKTGVSLKAIFMAAHIKVLSLLTGQADVLTGMSCHGRPELLDGEKVRGNFLNTVAYRIRLADETWAQLIKRTFNEETELLPYQRYPFALLQKKLGQQASIDTLFACLNFHSLQAISDSGKMEFLSDGNLDVGETSFALSAIFWISPFPEQTPSSLFLQYAREIPATQVKALGKWYVAVLQAVVDNPEASHTNLSLLHLLGDDERELLDQGTKLGELEENFIF